MKYEQDNLLEQYKNDFLDDWRVTDDVRDRANEEYRFTTVPGGQWEGWLENAYENRAKPELPHLTYHIDRQCAMWRQNRQQVNYQAADDSTSDAHAELLDGLLRRDLARSGGQEAIDTAVDEAFKCGFGAFVLNTEYEDEGDPDNDAQNIIFTEQPNAYSTVAFDSGARRADKRDAKHVTVLVSMTRKDFEAEYPDVNAESMMIRDRGWFNWGHNDLIYIAHRYHVDRTAVMVHTFSNPVSGDIVHVDHDDLDMAAPELEMSGYNEIRARKVYRKCIYKTVFTGGAILEEPRKVVGEYLPVIPVYGNRRYVDGVEHFHGLARPHMDEQRILNMCFGLAAESAAHSSDSKPILAPEQVTNPAVRNNWAQNPHQKPYHLVDPLRDSQGNPVRLAPDVLPGTSLSPATAQLIEMTTESLRSGLGGAPQDIADPNASGKAIQAIIKRVNLNTEVIFDNVAKAIRHCGVVYESMARAIYSAQRNRAIKIVTDRGESESVVLNAMRGEGGNFVPVNDISRGKVDVVVSTSTDYQTAREESFEALKDIILAVPEGSQWRETLALHLILLKDGQGLQEIKDYIRRGEILQGRIQPDSDEEKAMLAQAQQAAAQQGLDPNSEYLKMAAAEQRTQALLNEARIAKESAVAVKTAAEAEETKVDVALKKKELFDMTASN